jgi:hypothetical protein
VAVRFLGTGRSQRIQHRILRLLQIGEAQDHLCERASSLVMSTCHTGGLLCRKYGHRLLLAGSWTRTPFGSPDTYRDSWCLPNALETRAL